MGILYDLGVSSPQLDERERGFSYKQDAKLDMRMNEEASLTAYDVVNTYPYNDLVRIFFKYGEDKFSKQIARKIEQALRLNQLRPRRNWRKSLNQLSLLRNWRRRGIQPSKFFQAIRIEVNDELGAADESIQEALDLLAVDGRISVITFHSCEDRLTKQLFKEASTVDVPKGLPFIPEDLQPKVALVNRKPILPSQEELELITARILLKLRVAKKIRK